MEPFEKMIVRSLMRPVTEFPGIFSNASFMEAVETLDQLEDNFRVSKVPERILLAYDESGRIVGKLAPIDILQALEPNYLNFDKVKIGFLSQPIQSKLEKFKVQFKFWHSPLAELWQKARRVKIRDFLEMPQPEHILNANDKIEEALHLFAVTRQGSLFVRDSGSIAGLLLFSDIYKKIKEAIRTNPDA
ncbi:MAG: CBS domain-containing protein [Lentisphaerae bacterium]|nr:CBS domain-containing protein [Lentisphaerota bacterium]